MLLSIPLFADLFEKYGIERYLRHLLFAIVILAAATCVIYFITAENRHIAQWINDHSNIFQITYPDFGLRVLSKTGAFFPSGLLITLYFFLRERKIRYGLYFVIISYALYRNHTFSVFVAGLFTVYLSVIITIKSKLSKTFIAIVGIFVVLVSATIYLNDTYFHKKQSLEIKMQQTNESIALFLEKPITGQGLGFLYHDMDSRGKDTVMLEVSYLTILASTGILGSLFYMFIYLYYPIVSLINKYKERNRIILILLCLFSIMIAGLGNPFIFSGGMGLLFIVLLGATVEKRRNQY
jgi:hypothetical protein